MNLGNYAVALWPESKAPQRCPAKNCQRQVEFITAFDVCQRPNAHGHGGGIRRFNRPACSQHAKKFAVAHGLEMPTRSGRAAAAS